MLESCEDVYHGDLKLNEIDGYPNCTADLKSCKSTTVEQNINKRMSCCCNLAFKLVGFY